jgi:phage terminase large subunit
MGRQSRAMMEMYRAIREDIFSFCAAMNFSPTNQQAQLLQAVMDAEHGKGSNWIACKSGQGPGKTTVSTLIGLWRCLQDVDALTIVTAPTMRQCREVWLTECRRRLEGADPLLQRFIKVTKTKVEIGGRADWGVKTVTATKEENAQGFHEERMTVIVEEASGVPRPIITQFKGTLSNPNALLLQIGNPNSRDCDFYDCFNSNRDRWECFTFNAEDTARDYPNIVNPQRNKDLEEEFGRQSDVYRVRVLGEFPMADPNCVMSSDDVEACMKPSNMVRASQQDGAKVIGIDLARFGGDENAVYRRSGLAVMDHWNQSRVEPIVAVRKAFAMQASAGWSDAETLYVVDAGGIGQGILHVLYEAGKNVVEFHSGGVAQEGDKFGDAITEGWFRLAKAVKERRCYLPKDKTLIQQLSSRQYSTNKKGLLVLESKDQYMKRGYDSPDRADGVVYAFFDYSQLEGRSARGSTSVKRVGMPR